MAYVPHWKRQLAGEGFFHVDHLARQVKPFMPPRSHDCAEIFIVEDGIGTHEVNGELQSLIAAI